MGGVESGGSSWETETPGKEGNEMNGNVKDGHCTSAHCHLINLTLFFSFLGSRASSQEFGEAVCGGAHH